MTETRHKGDLRDSPPGPYEFRHQPRSFTKFPNEMFGRFKPSTAYVWIALQSHAWKRDGARPSIATIIEQTGLSENTVKRAIKQLVMAGELTVTPRGRAAPNLYGFPRVTAAAAFTKFENEWWSLSLTPGQAMVLVAIKHFSSLELGAVPGGRELARMTKQGRASVRTVVVPALERIRVLEVDTDRRLRGAKRMSNRYTIKTVSQIVDSFVVGSATAPHGSDVAPHGSELAPLRGSDMAPHGSETAPEEDGYKKTDPQEDSSRKNDQVPPRLRRAVAQAQAFADLEAKDEIDNQCVPEGLRSRMSRHRKTTTAQENDLVSVGDEGFGTRSTNHGVLDDGSGVLAFDNCGSPSSHRDALEPRQAPVAAPAVSDREVEENALEVVSASGSEASRPNAQATSSTAEGRWCNEPWSVRRKGIIARQAQNAATADVEGARRSLTERIEASLAASRTRRGVA